MIQINTYWLDGKNTLEIIVIMKSCVASTNDTPMFYI